MSMDDFDRFEQWMESLSVEEEHEYLISWINSKSTARGKVIDLSVSFRTTSTDQYAQVVYDHVQAYEDWMYEQWQAMDFLADDGTEDYDYDGL